MSHTSTSAILKALTIKMNELRHLQNRPEILGKWAHTFLQTCLGFDAHRDYRVSYSDIGRNWRPTLVISHEGKPFCTMEVGQPNIKRHKNISYALLFTGDTWRLYDTQSDNGVSLMAICDLSPFLHGPITEAAIVALEKDLSSFHETAFLSKTWETLAEEARKCNTDSVTNVLLSSDVLQLMQSRLGVAAKEPACHKLLHHKLVDMLQAETPVKVKKKTAPDTSAA